MTRVAVVKPLYTLPSLPKPVVPLAPFLPNAGNEILGIDFSILVYFVIKK